MRTFWAAVLLAVLPLLPAKAALDEDWTTIAVGDLFQARMDRSGNDLFFVWVDANTGDVVFQRHGDSAPIVMSGGDFAGFPTLLAEKSDVHVAWMENGKLYVRTSRNRGASFGPAVEVSGSFRGGPSVMAKAGGRLYVAWTYSDEDEIGGVAIAVSKNRGASFADPIRLDDDRGHGDARIAAHGNGVHVVWDDWWRNDDPRIRIRSSRAHGKNFGPMQILSPYESSWSQADVGQIHAHANRVYLGWNQRDQDVWPNWTSTLYFARSLDRGQSFEAPVVIAMEDAAHGKMAASKKHVAFVWEPRDPFSSFYTSELYLRESFDGGDSFGTAIDISQSPATASQLLGLEVDGGKTHVIWREALPAPGGFQWFRGMTIENGVAGPFVHLMDDTIDVLEVEFQAKYGHIDILALEWTSTGYRLLYRHATGTFH